MKLSGWTKEIEASLKRKINVDESIYLDKLGELLEELDWRDTLYVKDLASLDKRFKELSLNPQKSVTEGLWLEKPETEYSLWQYIALVFDDYKIEAPEFLKTSTDIRGTRETIAQRERRKDIQLWRNRLGNLSQKRIGPAQTRLDVRLKLQGRAFKWERSPAGTNEFRPLHAKDLIQWLEKDYGFLDRFSTSCLALCSIFQDYYRSVKRVRLDLDKPDDCSLLNRLIQNSATAHLIVDRNGNPITIDARPLRWIGLEKGANDSGSYELHLGFDDESDIPVLAACLPGADTLYFRNEKLHRGPSLFRADAKPNDVFKIPAESLESPEGLLYLKSLDLPLPKRLENQVVVIPLKLAAYLKLEKERAEGRQTMQLQLVSSSIDKKHWFKLSEEGWIESANIETGEKGSIPEKGSLFEYPEYGSLLSALKEYGLVEEDEALWQKEVNEDFPELFKSLIQNLPDNIQIIADDELDTLVDSRPAGRYAIHIDKQADGDWFDLGLKPEFSDSTLTENEIALLLRSPGKYVSIPGKGWKRFEPSVDVSQTEFLDTLGVDFREGQSETRSLHALQLADAKLEDLRFKELAKEIKKRAKEISNVTPSNLPKGIVTDLRPYQVEGFQFLTFLSTNGFGGVLADDMGLGKTLQALTWLAWLKLRHPKEERFQCLVVCPKSVVHVWKQEVARHSNLLSIALYDSETINKPIWDVSEIDILVANYSQLRIQRGFFTSVDWTTVILDEGQYIKNPSSQTAKVARELKAKHRVVLTGTPIENRSLDLWSLFSFSMPGLVGSQASFKRQYKESDPQTPKRLSNRVKHFLLRRSKLQVAPDLPDRIEETLTCHLEGEQLELYQAELKQSQNLLLNLNSAADLDKQRFNILASLLRLRQISCHPRLLDGAYADIRSAKLEALLDLVSELKEEGHKVLIFSQFVEMLSIISEELDALQCPHLILTGQSKNREQLVEEFQNDSTKGAFLLSLRAAGYGLNLTAASYVILYDPWWNPAVEAQAIDRTHPIGQKNTVDAYRPIAGNTVEQRIQSLQLKKEALANEIVQEESLGNILDLENLKYVLSNNSQ